MSISDDLSERAARSAANLRFAGTAALLGDVVVAIILLLLRESLGIGDLAYMVAPVMVVSGVSLLIVLPRLPWIALKERERREQVSRQLFEGKRNQP